MPSLILKKSINIRALLLCFWGILEYYHSITIVKGDLMSYWSAAETERTERLTVLLTKEEKQQIINTAKARKSNMSDFVRNAILGESFEGANHAA